MMDLHHSPSSRLILARQDLTPCIRREHADLIRKEPAKSRDGGPPPTASDNLCHRDNPCRPQSE
jgi:hypothetical protein